MWKIKSLTDSGHFRKTFHAEKVVKEREGIEAKAYSPPNLSGVEQFMTNGNIGEEFYQTAEQILAGGFEEPVQHLPRYSGGTGVAQQCSAAGCSDGGTTLSTWRPSRHSERANVMPQSGCTHTGNCHKAHNVTLHTDHLHLLQYRTDKDIPWFEWFLQHCSQCQIFSPDRCGQPRTTDFE